MSSSSCFGFKVQKDSIKDPISNPLTAAMEMMQTYLFFIPPQELEFSPSTSLFGELVQEKKVQLRLEARFNKHHTDKYIPLGWLTEMVRAHCWDREREIEWVDEENWVDGEEEENLETMKDEHMGLKTENKSMMMHEEEMGRNPDTLMNMHMGLKTGNQRTMMPCKKIKTGTKNKRMMMHNEEQKQEKMDRKLEDSCKFSPDFH
ncbi:hypothetical protein MKW98_022572 [Papaver atlanticum]|uniref:Uncharacterized protein n=1 Tax=Papaver atlanticum TaxID=357466 RepID=A0AAD4SKX8_9MAGN|nr:hypothetical protein MKW98_022572 [Papaver atlanticum]